jgi:hypothetical protein
LKQLAKRLRPRSTEDNAVVQKIAARLVQHQHTTDPAPQAILISLPKEGEVYTFARSVQVAENAPLELELGFRSKFSTPFWRTSLVLILLIGIGSALAFVRANNSGGTHETTGTL